MTQPSRFTQADVTRLLRAAKATGFESAVVTVELDGRLVLTVGLMHDSTPITMRQELE